MKFIVSVNGGMGNQMFQYAFYKYLANKYNNVYLDISYYDYFNSHTGYDLCTSFKLDSCISYSKGPLAFKYRTKVSYLNAMSQYFNNIVIRQRDLPHISFLDELCVSNCTYRFDGLWQNEAYFQPITKQIFKDFTFNDFLVSKGARFFSLISSSNSVSVHVRRGDYLTSPKHNVITLDYIYNAIKNIRKKVPDPTFFVFSDDLQWAKDHLVFDNFYFVDASEDCHPAVDMYLMSQCKHNIISNSTFSWWSAYLNRNKNKLVCAPYIWAKGVSSAKHVPSSWSQILF